MKSPLLQKNGFWSHLKESRPPWYQNAEANLDPIGVILPIVSAMQAWLNHPAELVETSAQMVRDLTKLSENSWKRMTGMSSEELMKPAVFDRRFIDSTWLDTPVYRNLLEHYLYLSESFERII